MADLQSSPLSAVAAFNWIFLVEYITCGILALFFLFYFNRLVATILAYCLRLYTWYAFRVYIDIQALQISFLAGRCFFKGIRYHGNNETIFVHSGYITWRYWLYSVRNAEIYEDVPQSQSRGKGAAVSNSTGSNASEGSFDEKATAKSSKDLPCRISAKLSGVEAFIYNRSPSYDWILENISKLDDSSQTARDQAAFAQHSEKTGHKDLDRRKTIDGDADPVASLRAADGDPSPLAPIKTEATIMSHGTSTTVETDLQSQLHSAAKIPTFLQLLPIHVECSTAAAVLGNENTKAIITAKISSASGMFDAAKSGPLDIFKIVMDFEAEKPVINMKPNFDYKRPQLAEGVALKEMQRKSSPDGGLSRRSSTSSTDDNSTEDGPSFWKRMHRRLRQSPWLAYLSRASRQSLDSLATYAVRLGNSQDPLPNVQSDLPHQERWLGLRRYLDDELDDERDEWDPVEYAKVSNIAEIDRVKFKFFWDIPGSVPLTAERRFTPTRSNKGRDINGEPPPEYGMELAVCGGRVNYGPWADRHRIILQQIFFPASYVDAVPTRMLKAGEARVSTIFTLSLTIEEDTVLRIPFREASKDWKWKGRAKNLSKPDGDASGAKGFRSNKRGKPKAGAVATDVRPFAWFDLRVGRNTTIRYIQDMLPMATGFTNKLSVDAKMVEISSSLNHALLWRSQGISMNCDLSHPLAWNGLREWLFDITISDLDFYLLRDHTFLLMDLIDDWTRGPLPDFHTFAPYRYLLKVHFINFKLWLNVNDANIVNSSDDNDDNDFVILYGETLDSDLTIPLDRFRPTRNEITFDVVSKNLGFELRLPAKNTLNAFLLDKNVAQLPEVLLNGSYTYCSVVEPGLSETLVMRIIGKGLCMQFYGFLGRQLAKIKENYFGEDLHFKTLDEYQELAQHKPVDANVDVPHTKSNDLDVILDITAEDASFLLPSNLYGAEEHVRVHVDTADIDLRVSNYYLELMVNSSPITFSYTSRKLQQPEEPSSTSGVQMYIDGLQVYGHRLFGLPPTEPNYVSNWDISAGDILGECSTIFLGKLVTAAQSLVYSFPDHENAIPLPHLPSLHDATYVRFDCRSIGLWFPMQTLAFNLRSRDISGTFNDFAGTLFSQRLKMRIPELSVACANIEGHSWRNQANGSSVETFAYVRTSIVFDMVQRAKAFQQERELQQEHIRMHDARTRRAQFLLSSIPSDYGKPRNRSEAHVTKPVSMDLPSLPAPIGASKVHEGLITPGPAHRKAKTDDRSVTPSNHRRAQLRRHSSASSISTSIRSASAKTEGQFLAPINVLQRKSSMLEHDVEDSQHTPRDRGKLQSTTLLSSSFEPPLIALDDIKLDLRDVPRIDSSIQPRQTASLGSGEQIFEDGEDNDAIHTSFMICVEPGVEAYVRPEAVRGVANLLSETAPQCPDDILDLYTFVTTMGVLASLSKKHGKNNIMDIRADVPRLCLRADNRDPNSTSSEQVCDRFDVILSQMVFNFRSKIMPERPHEDDSTAMHTTVGSITVAAREHTLDVANEDEAALKLQIDDVMLWLTDSNRTAIHGSFNMIEAALASQKIDYVAALSYRTAMLVEDLQPRFLQFSSTQTARTQYLVYELVQGGKDVPDPAFLTSPSYVLRSAKNHIRNTDSWKILSRMRQIWMRLPLSIRSMITQNCLEHKLEMPHDAESTVLTELDQWRSWETIHVKDSFAVQALYGAVAGAEGVYTRKSIPIGVTVQGSGVRLLVDPGPKESEVTIKSVSIAVTVTPPPPRSAALIFHDYPNTRATVVQIGIAHTALRLDWEVFELVDKTLSLFEGTTIGSSLAAPKQTKSATTEAEEQSVHVVFASRTGSIQLEMINLTHKLYSQDICISFYGNIRAESPAGMDLNGVLSTSSTSHEILNKSNSLIVAQVIEPSLCFGYNDSDNNAASQISLKLAGDCKQITFEVLEEIHGLVEVASLVLSDEVNFLNSLIGKHGKSSGGDSKPPSEQPPRKSFTINVTLFLDKYTVQIALLHDLHYQTSGNVVRLAVLPDSSLASAFRIDYDLKAQRHSLIRKVTESSQSTAYIDMPPINGTVRSLHSSKVITATGQISIEKMEFDGSAIYQMFGLLSVPEVVNAVSIIKDDAEVVMKKFQDMFPRAEVQTQSTKTAIPFIFDGSVSLAGLSVSAVVKTPGNKSASTQALFQMGYVQFRAANRSPTENSALPFPEMRLWLGEMGIYLSRMGSQQVVKCGEAVFGSIFTCDIEQIAPGTFKRNFKLSAAGPEIRVTPDTAPALVHVLLHLQDRFKGLDLSMEKKYLRRLRHHDFSGASASPVKQRNSTLVPIAEDAPGVQYVSDFSFKLRRFEIFYTTNQTSDDSDLTIVPHDLVMTLRSVSLETRSESGAIMTVQDLQIQLCPRDRDRFRRSSNSALLPQVKFILAHKATESDRKLRILAIGKALDLQLDPDFVLPAYDLQDSIAESIKRARADVANLQAMPNTGELPLRNVLGDRTLSSFTMEASFAGAVIMMQDKASEDDTTFPAANTQHRQEFGRYGQFVDEGKNTKAILRAPSIKTKATYVDNGIRESTFIMETRVDPSSNTLHPSVVPLILKVVHSVEKVMDRPGKEQTAQEQENKQQLDQLPAIKYIDEEAIIGADPKALLGRAKLSIGFRVCRQEFTMTCQPLAKVAASALIDDIYVTINTVESTERGNFFAISAAFSGMNASLQHVYSRDATFRFDIESIVLSLMNSRHVSGKSGISAILNINPTKAQINAKQLQDILLFREIWLPVEIRQASRTSPSATVPTASQDYFVHRYHQVAASTSFNWNATVSITELNLELDLGQAIGKTDFQLSNVWAASKKASSAQQTLCFGIDRVMMDSMGRMSGYVSLDKVKVRTSIAWPPDSDGSSQPSRPLIQGSIGFDSIRIKAAFDYQVFAIVDIQAFEFIMYNVRDSKNENEDRLVAILDGDRVSVYCVSTSAAMALSLFQAFERLVQEKKASYNQALRDVERFLRRGTTMDRGRRASRTSPLPQEDDIDKDLEPPTKSGKLPLTLHNDVVVTLRSIDVGAFPGSFSDTQLLRLTATDMQARFAVAVEPQDRIHSGLGLTLGQVSAALSSVPYPVAPKKLGEITIDEVSRNAQSSRGGIILRVPKVIASMQTWQGQESKNIDYIFKSSFEGKIDVGWNYSRISYIRGMWANHSRTLASRLGRPLPESALKISAGPQPLSADGQTSNNLEVPPTSGEDEGSKEQQKITAVVSLPQSTYTYRALEPPVIEAPQLRDMGEATPPLEWIGLHRDRLPNVTHQIVIVTLLEVAKEVEDAYTQILGSAKS